MDAFARGLKILRAADAETVYTGISFDKLDRAAPPHLTRAKLNIPEDWQVVMTAGRTEMDRLIQAAGSWQPAV